MAWDTLISRTLWLLLQPSNLFFVLLLLSAVFIWRGRRRTGLSLLTFCIIFYGAVMSGPLVNWIIVPLEQRFSIYTNKLNGGPYSGIIVLAGSERRLKSARYDQVTLSGAGERLIETAKLARRFPTLPIIYCGIGRLDDMLSEADVARKFFSEAGIDLARIRFDETVYNTHTGAIAARKLISEDETGKWLLVTSAFHMPRAVGAHRNAGINIQPYPVDYRSVLSGQILHSPNAGERFYIMDLAVHEWAGLLAYYVRGHAEDLFPAPEQRRTKLTKQ